MLTKEMIQEKIKHNAFAFRAHGINKIGLFGSYARREQKSNSDIDILIDFEDGKETFDNFMAVSFLLDSLFKDYKVEVVTQNGMSPFIGPHILNSVEYVQITNCHRTDH
ncbi:MAG: nucleotidyltransferase family protein [Saprospiraceae bacterium]|nr:nucleotidyltransferase family protein [Saprospiraceae bacterium]